MADPTASRISASSAGRAEQITRPRGARFDQAVGASFSCAVRGLVVLVFLAVSAVPSFGRDAAVVDRAMAALYHRVGNRALAEGERSLAIRLWETAATFAPDSSDVLCSLGQVYVSRQETVARGVAVLQDAVDAGTFHEHSEEDCARHLASALRSVRRYEDAVAILLRYPFPERPLYFELLGWCLLRTGRGAAAVDALARGVTRHPADLLLQALLAHAEGRGLGLDDGDAPLLARLDTRELQLLLRLDLPPSDIRSAAGHAADRAPPPPEALFHLLLLEEVDDARLDTFLDVATPARMDLVARLYSARQDESPARLIEAHYAGATGTYRWDEDADGFWEQRVVFEAGLIRRWDVDENQDGRTENRVTFSDGRPAEVRLGEERRLVYDTYPFVAAIIVRAADTETRYDVVPGRFAVPVIPEAELSGLTPYSPPRLRRGFDVLAWIDPVAVAYRGEVFPAGGGQPVRRMELVDGMAVSLAEDTDRDGSFDRFVHLEDGVAVRATRDLDADGSWEVAEYFVAGQPERYVVDLDGDGNAEYGMRPGPGGEQFWDFDDDGVVDLRRRDP